MKNTKIVKLLKTFSKKELKELGTFINSPAQLKKRDVRKTFGELKKFYPDFNAPGFTDEKFFKKIFPGMEFNQSKYSIAAFHLFDAACEYLIALNYHENKIERAFSLMNQFISRGMNNAFGIMAKKMDKEIISSKMSLDNFFFYRYGYEDLLMRFYISQGESDLRFKSFHNKINLSTGLFLLRFLKGLPNIRIAEEVYKVEIDTRLTKMMIDALDVDKIFSNPGINPYLKILEVLYFLYKGLTESDSEEWAIKADETFFKNVYSYDHDESVNITFHLMNLYSKLISQAKNRKERDRFSRMQLEMVKSILKYGLTKNMNEPYMRDLFYRNVVFTALDIREFDWAEQFIRKYNNDLKPRSRENLTKYCLAMLEFDRGNLDKSLEYLSTVKYNSFYYKSDVKNLLMVLYYELKLLEEAHYMLNATKKYLKTTKDMTKEDRVVYSNFLYHYNNLLKYFNKPDKISIKMEIDEIKRNEVKIEYSDWLLKKFREIL